MAYATNVCPYVFSHTRVETVEFLGISNSFLSKNKLEFVQTNDTDSFISDLLTLRFEVNYVEITSKLVHTHLFAKLRNLHLSGHILGIQVDLLKDFSAIKVINLELDHVEPLFTNKGLKWLAYLNLNRDIQNGVYVIFREKFVSLAQAYTYPDRDLCLFGEFPHENFVYPIIKSHVRLNCTCTIVWLIQYAENAEFYESSVSYCFAQLRELMITCEFGERFKKCHNKSDISPRIGVLAELSDTRDSPFWVYLVKIYIQPLLCVFSLVTNSLTILVVRNRRVSAELRKNFTSVIYKHIVFNAAFNLVYSSIKLFALVNICVLPYCSSIYKTKSSQYLKMYLLLFAGNAIRLGANFSYIFYSTSRYYLSVTTVTSAFFKKYQRINIKLLYSLVFGGCLAFSSYRIFEYSINLANRGPASDFPRDDCEYIQYSTLPVLSKCRFFAVISTLNTIVNDMVFVVMSVFIDVGLIKFTNLNLERRRRLFSDPDASALVQAVKLKERINRMIVTNGVLYVISHVPEFVVALLFLVCPKYLDSTQRADVAEMTQAFNFVVIGTQMFLFMRFDRNFSASMRNLFHKKERVVAATASVRTTTTTTGP